LKTILFPDLNDLLEQATKHIHTLKGKLITQTVTFFDLSRSTELKLIKGHDQGMDFLLRFVTVASEITMKCQGIVVKRLGDGVLCRFSDPFEACRAALNLKKACIQLNLVARFALTIGRISIYENFCETEEILGDAVDRCFRILNLAYPGQILIDRPLFEVVRSHLAGDLGVVVGDTFRMRTKGFGIIELCEISTSDLPLINKIVTPFSVHPEGRLSIVEKIQFVNQAEEEILEIGTGLTAFAKYFTGQKPKEFRNPITDLLMRGVSVKCYAVDPDYEPARIYLAERGESDYRQDLMRAREMIVAERKHCLEAGYRGQIRYFAYRLIPEFYCFCVDGGNFTNARMLFSPYLPGLARPECPVYQVSRIADPELFEKCWTAISVVQAHSTEIQ